MSRRPGRIVAALAGIAACAGLTVASLAAVDGGPAVGATTNCAATQAVTGNATALLITPPTAVIDTGQCDTFKDSTNGSITITVAQTGTAFREVVQAGGSINYSTSQLGGHRITATELFASAPGKVTVEPATTTSPSPSPSPSATSASASTSATAVASASTGRRNHRKHHNGATTVPSLTIPPGETASPYSVQKSPGGISPLVAGQPIPVTPTTLTPAAPLSSQSSVPVATTTARVRGGNWDLLLAVAAMLALGQLLALGRVLLVVDGRRRSAGPRA